MSLKQLSKQRERLSPGHRLCAGCAEPTIVRMILHAIDKPVVIGNATGCLEVATTIYPYTAWRVPWIHNAFENVAATISGVESCYRKFRKDGRINEEIRFLAFAGDGGTYDIGLQSLSGALERGHRFLYVCFDNQAYMNTGIQRSSATPRGASTTTSPAGEVIPGKKEYRKDITRIIAAHDTPYVAQASPSHWMDLIRKTKKAVDVDGPSFINVLSPCPRGWRYPANESIEMARLAVETCHWPLYEVVDGEYKVTFKPREKKPVVEWLKKQRRFRHLMTPENKDIITSIQEKIDRDWDRLLALSK